jgi:hypothetical protein
MELEKMAQGSFNPDCPLGFEELADAFASQFCPE